MLVKRNIIFFLTHLCVLCMGSLRDRWPEYDYYPELQGWIKLHIEPAYWMAARVKCHMEGAFLTSPWSAEFTSAINKLQDISNQLSNEDTLPALYSGVHTTFAEGELSYGKGKPSILMYPSGFGSLERCGVFFANGTTGDVSCNQRLPYVCYAPGSEQEPTKVSIEKTKEKTTEKTTVVTEPTEGSSEESPADRELDRQLDVILAYVLLPPLTLILSPDCGEQSLGYKFCERTQKCYKFHAKAVRTWYDAKRACEAEGAHLAIVNSFDEAKVLSNLFQEYPPEKIHGASYNNTAAIGYYKGSLDYWKTIEGETLEQAGYSNWRPDAPHPWAKLGFIYRDGLLWGYVKSIRNVPFICEKRPSTAKLDPELTEELSKEPTKEPTEEPTVKTTEEPTVKTTEEPTVNPTEEFDQASVKTTEEPTVKTTEEPTVNPTEEFDQASVKTTEEPTVKTTEEPTVITREEFDQASELVIILSTKLASDCGEKSLGYEFSEKTRRCYKFHAKPTAHTWYDAKKACEEEGAHLAIVNSDDEAKVLANLFVEYAPVKLHGTFLTNTAAIGYFKSSSKDWETIHGETLELAGYSTWKPYAPHVWSRFGSICRDGRLYAFGPTIRDIPFICEKTPL